MSYCWKSGECILAWKLNASQQRPLMEAIDKSGVAGGFENSAVDMSSYEDAGTWESPVARVTCIREHNQGNIKYEYDDSLEQWTPRTGSGGVTGNKQLGGNALNWLTNNQLNNNTKVWDKIETDKWGNPTAVCRLYDSCCTHNTTMWNPKDNTPGEVYRKVADVAKNDNLGDGPWSYCIINNDDAVILPVARPVGSENVQTLDPTTDTDLNGRLASAKWVPVAGNDVGNTVPITSVGEMGGTFVYHNCHNGEMGIGIASGVEFYGPCETPQKTNMRPSARSARVDFGSDGKNGFIAIEALNCRPWQFKLTGNVVIPCGGGGGDPGSNFDPGSSWWEREVNKIPFAHHQVMLGGKQAFEWYGITCTDLGSGFVNGIMHPCVYRVKLCKSTAAQSIVYKCVPSKYNYLAGEIKCGALGIGTARFNWVNPWTDPGSTGYDLSCCFIEMNHSGGTVTGIANDMGSRPHIDDEGFIHLPNPEWNARYGVKTAHWWCEIDGTPTANPGTICTIRPNPGCHKNRIENGNILLATAHYYPGEDDEGDLYNLCSYYGVVNSISTSHYGGMFIHDGEIVLGAANYDCEEPDENYPGLVSSIGWFMEDKYPKIIFGDIILNGAYYNAKCELFDHPGGIQSIRVGEDCGDARICEGRIVIPKADSKCGYMGVITDIQPGSCGWGIRDGVAEVPYANFQNPSASNEIGVIGSIALGGNDLNICEGHINIPAAHTACSIIGVVTDISISEDCRMKIEHGVISIPLADSGSGSSGGTVFGIVGNISVGTSGSSRIRDGIIEIAGANWNIMYPQFARPGVVSSIDWHDCYDAIDSGDVHLATANWDPGPDGWMQPQRTGGVKAMCWGVSANNPSIDNGNLIMPVATYYPCAGMAPSGVVNKPGLIRGVKTFSCLRGTPYIDACGYLHLRG